MEDECIRRSRALRAIAISESKETAYDAVSSIEAEKTGRDALKEIDENLRANVMLMVEEPSDYNAGRKDAFEDIDRMVCDYLEDLND